MLSAREMFQLPLRELILSTIERQAGRDAIWHPLGFVSSTLQADDSGILKLHLWPRGERRPKQPNWAIHDHSFHISSRVLAGKVQNVSYEVIPGESARRYTVSYTNFDSVLVATSETVDCITVATKTMVAGDRYELPLGTYHETIVPAPEMSLTIVLKSGGEKVPPNVIGELDIPELEMYKRTSYPGHKIIELLDELAAAS